MADTNLATTAHATAERYTKSFHRKALSWIASAAKSTWRKRRLFALDLTLSAVTLILASWLRFGPQLFLSNPEAAAALAVFTPVFVVICAVTFPAAGLYKRKWKYASIVGLHRPRAGDPDRLLILTTCVFLYSGFAIIPHSIVAIEIVTLTSLLAAVRLAFRQEDLRTLAPIALRGAADSDRGFPSCWLDRARKPIIYLRALQRDALRPIDRSASSTFRPPRPARCCAAFRCSALRKSSRR